MVRFLTLLLLVGCTDSNPLTGGGGGSSDGSGGSDGSDGAGPPEKIEAGTTFKAKEKTGLLILPGTISGPPPPAEGITRGQCGDLSDGGAVSGPGCVTAEIECGQTVIGHTKGGVQMFDTRFYEKFFCTPATTNHNGGDERVYHLVAPDGKKRLWVTLDTPCADLDLAVIKYGGSDCPNLDSVVPDCEMWPKSGSKREVVDLTSTGTSDWLIVVEGKDDEEGAFAVTVQCVDW